LSSRAELTPIREGKLRELKKVDYGNAKACRACALRPRCTKDVRAVSRLENEDALERMAERLKARPEILDRRREIVEHPFGTVKQWMNQGAFLMRGLEKVRAEFSLTALAYNLRRALKHHRHGKADGGCGGVKTPKSRQIGRQGLLQDRPVSASEVRSSFWREMANTGQKPHQALAIFNPLPFPHSLLEFCTFAVKSV
jgi:hypothetical protein